MNSIDTEEEAIDISDIGVQVTDYVCPYCDVVMHPLHWNDEAVSLEAQCPSCGYKLDPTIDQTKHASKLTPKITEEMIADEEEEGNSNIFEVIADEDSSRAADDDDQSNDFTEDDKRDEEGLKRKGYRILSSKEF